MILSRRIKQIDLYFRKVLWQNMKNRLGRERRGALQQLESYCSNMGGELTKAETEKNSKGMAYRDIFRTKWN